MNLPASSWWRVEGPNFLPFFRPAAKKLAMRISRDFFRIMPGWPDFVFRVFRRSHVQIVSRVLFLLLSGTTLSAAESPADTRMPPRGIPVPAVVRAELESGVKKLGDEIEHLRTAPQFKTLPIESLPDVQLYYNAVRYALEDDIFYQTNDFATARKFLKEGEARLRDISNGHATWNTNTGLLVRGYASKLDGSVQPYGLVVPASYRRGDKKTYRLDFWFHGRGDKLSELDFINQREKNPGEFTPPDTFVLHPYGRYCNAYKFAGEVDVFEALADVERHYPIDTNRISVRGFSMGGAATWHLAAHHAGLWAAASPGAGFVDTPVYQKIFEKKPLPPWYEQKLWHLYDAVDYAGNLFNCGLVAYSGGIDPQKQAADLMANAMAAEGLKMTHIIGPNTGHKYEPKAKEEVARLVDAIADKGRKAWPKEIKFTTWTLRYNQMDWVTVDGLEKHWERARVNARIVPQDENAEIQVATTNVLALTLQISDRLHATGAIDVVIDNQPVGGDFKESQTCHFKRTNNKWMVNSIDDSALAKRHGLQGPIDDAFMDSFIGGRPTGPSENEASAKWIRNRMADAIAQWRLQFRGVPRVKDDVSITSDDIASNNLVLWGDPQSNQLLAKIAAQLPIRWEGGEIQVGQRKYAADKNVPVLIYPNPLNPKRYVVINSGFTFSGAAHLSNALQTPKLPDYAVIDFSSQSGDGVVDAGFFDEHWQLATAK